MRYLLFLSLAFLGLSRVFTRLEVEGESMTPTYMPGQRLVVNRLTLVLRPPRVGEAVVVRQPGSNGRLDLKRVSAGPGEEVEIKGARRSLAADEWFVTGDNAAQSTDGRHLGPVRRRDIVGTIWFSY